MSLDPYEELELVGRMNLRGMHRFGGGWNFSCPLCDEGSKKSSRRGYVLAPRGRFSYSVMMCHNCLPQGTSVRSFIQMVDPMLFEEYVALEKKQRMDDLKTGKLASKKVVGEKRFEAPERDVKFFKLNRKYFVRARQSERAVAYARKRMIPEEVIDELMYCPHEKVAGKRSQYFDMLIFPLWAEEPREDIHDTFCYGFQGRSIDGPKRFATFTKNDSFKVYGFFRVDRSRRVYVFESIIDSLSISNAMSMMGSSLSERVKKQLEDYVLVFDNDKTGLEKALAAACNGEKVFVWPSELRAKDFNTLLQVGVTSNQLEKVLKQHTKSGFAATAALKLKKTTMKR